MEVGVSEERENEKSNNKKKLTKIRYGNGGKKRNDEKEGAKLRVNPVWQDAKLGKTRRN